jgi:hypothetical protein
LANTKLEDLIEEVENSNNSDPSLDLKIMKYLKYADEKSVLDGNSYKIPNSRHSTNLISYTSSIDAALRLIPKDWKVFNIQNLGYWDARVNENTSKGIAISFNGSHDIMAMSIVIAALKIKHYIGE